MKLRTPLLFVALLLTAAACSSSNSEAVPVAESSSATDQAADPQTSDASNNASDETVGDSGKFFEGDPDATLTIGDQTWTFNALICSISTPEEGQQSGGSSITALNDESRFAVTTHPILGNFADFTDFDFENAVINFSSGSPATSMTIDGNSFTGIGQFVDNTTDSLDLIPGTFSGTCS